MNLPKVVADLVSAQDSFDSLGYAACFSESAVVFDEGKTHKGKAEIRQWIAKANEQYKTVINPIGYEASEKGSIMTASISGTFEGSPIVLNYHFVIAEGLIESLSVTV